MIRIGQRIDTPRGPARVDANHGWAVEADGSNRHELVSVTLETPWNSGTEKAPILVAHLAVLIVGRVTRCYEVPV